MNKKVVTFFSAIWNTISWRKPNKKAKQVAKTAKEDDQGGIYSNKIPETGKLFFDVPLHSPEANELLDQEILIIRDEVPAALAPIGAVNCESCVSDADHGAKEYSKGSQIFVFEEETSQNLSFFSEPSRVSDHESFATLETVKSVLEDGEIEQNPATSCREVGPIGISVSSIQANPDSSECTTDCRSKYQTNYMVKSDSLVNFLLEDVNNLMEDISDKREELTEISEHCQAVNSEILLHHGVPLPEKRCLEEVMCTARGILKLSSDHHINCVDENDGKVDVPQESHVKTSVDDFLKDGFSYEDPLLMAHHFEGCIMEESSLECEDFPISQEILRTETENMFPSFSRSSVQGCCPSIFVQSCETRLSNDSLPSIILEEKNDNSKSMIEDYSTTEKFMNDVNTALNASVLDHIQGRVDLQSNLLGRGDGSMPMNSDQSDHHERIEISAESIHHFLENDVLLRNSLGENISINNSKLTLLDGVLGPGNGGSRPDPMHTLTCNLRNERSDSINEFCLEVLDSIVENVTRLGNEATAELHIEIAETNADGKEEMGDEPLLPANPERDLIVQNMMYVDSLSDQAVQIWSKCIKRKKQTNVGDNETAALLEDAVGKLRISDDDVQKTTKTFVGHSEELAAEPTPDNNSQRSRRQRKKMPVVSSEHEIMPSVSGNNMVHEIGVEELSQSIDQCQLMGRICYKPEEKNRDTSKSEDLRKTSKTKLDGELVPNKNPEEPPKSGQDVAQKDDEVDGHSKEEDGPCENPGNPSTNRRRRNRRKKRKN